MPGLNHGQGGLGEVEAVLVRVLVDVVVPAQSELYEARVVCRNVGGDADDLPGLVVSHYHTVGKLSTRGLVILHRGVPGVSTDATPSHSKPVMETQLDTPLLLPTIHPPLVRLASTEALHPIVVRRIVGKAVEMHHSPRRGLHHGAMTWDRMS